MGPQGVATAVGRAGSGYCSWELCKTGGSSSTAPKDAKLACLLGFCASQNSG